MGAKIVGATPCIAFSKAILHFVYGSTVLTQENIRLEGIGPMLEVDRQDVELCTTDDGRSLVYPLDEVGDPHWLVMSLGASHSDTSRPLGFRGCLVNKYRIGLDCGDVDLAGSRHGGAVDQIVWGNAPLLDARAANLKGSAKLGKVRK